MKKNRLYVFLLLICIVALLVRLAVFFLAERNEMLDTYEFETVASNLLNGEGFVFPRFDTQYRSGIAPLYPFLCATMYFLFGHHHCYIFYLQIILSAVMCCLIFKISQRFFDQKVSLLSAFLVGFHPGLVIYSSMKLHSFTIYAFLICVIILMIIKTFDFPSYRNQILLGAFFGLGILTRSTIIIFLPFSFLWLYRYLKNKKAAMKLMFRVVTIVFLLLLPWLIRIYSLYNEFIFIQTNQWEAFWVGNNVNASGTLYLPSGETVLEASSTKFKEQLYSLDELGQLNLFRAKALEYIKNNPREFLILTLKKFIYFWYFSPQSGILYSTHWFNLYKFYYIIVSFFALLGFIYTLKSNTLRKFGILIILFFISISMLHSFYYVEGRHRWSIESFILIFSAIGLFWLFEWFRKRIIGYVLPKASS